MSFSTSLSGGWYRLTLCIVKMNCADAIGGSTLPAGEGGGDNRALLPLARLAGERDRALLAHVERGGGDGEREVAGLDHEAHVGVVGREPARVHLERHRRRLTGGQCEARKADEQPVGTGDG